MGRGYGWRKRCCCQGTATAQRTTENKTDRQSLVLISPQLAAGINKLRKEKRSPKVIEANEERERDCDARADVFRLKEFSVVRMQELRDRLSARSSQPVFSQQRWPEAEEERGSPVQRCPLSSDTCCWLTADIEDTV